MNKLIKFFDSCVRSIKARYISIFKAGIILLGVGLAGLSEPFMKVIEIDYETKRMLFEVIADSGVKEMDISSIDCFQLEGHFDFKVLIC